MRGGALFVAATCMIYVYKIVFGKMLKDLHFYEQ